MDRRPVLARFVQWLALLGVTDSDPDETRAQKVALTLAASLIMALAIIWVATYWALGLFEAAAIPFAYQVVSLGSLAVFARTKSYGFFRFTQALLMTLLPFLLQWSLGGYVASSAVSLWRHRPAQVRLRPMGRHRQHGEPHGVARSPRPDPSR